MPDKPLPYNRFAGNPPAGETPEQAYENETGKPWVPDTDAEKIKELEAKNKELQEQLSKLQNAKPQVQQTQHAKKA